MCDDFNPDSVIEVSSFSSFDEVVSEVERIDQDWNAFMAVLNASVFKNNFIHVVRRRRRAFLEKLVEYVMRGEFKRPRYGHVAHYEKVTKRRARESAIYRAVLRMPIKQKVKTWWRDMGGSRSNTDIAKMR